MFEQRLQQFITDAADELLADRFNRELEECGSYLTTKVTGVHYELFAERMHSETFYNMKLAFQHLANCELCALILMRKLAKSKVLGAINMIAGPRRGAGPLIQTLAHYLPGKNIRTILLDSEQDGDGNRIFTVEPHTELTSDDHMLLVDDALSSGKTIRLCIEGFERFSRVKFDSEFHPQVVAVAVAVNRAPASWEPEHFMPTTPLVWAVRNPVEKYPQVACPSCKAGVKLVRVA